MQDGQEMEHGGQGPETTLTDHGEAVKLAHAPSRFIGTPLKDFDSGKGRVRNQLNVFHNQRRI